MEETYFFWVFTFLPEGLSFTSSSFCFSLPSVAGSVCLGVLVGVAIMEVFKKVGTRRVRVPGPRRWAGLGAGGEHAGGQHAQSIGLVGIERIGGYAA